MSVAAPWPRTRSRSSLVSSAEQGARTVMGLSVAVVLGFNIGGGNIRSRIGAGATHTSCSALLLRIQSIDIIVASLKKNSYYLFGDVFVICQILSKDNDVTTISMEK